MSFIRLAYLLLGIRPLVASISIRSFSSLYSLKATAEFGNILFDTVSSMFLLRNGKFINCLLFSDLKNIKSSHLLISTCVLSCSHYLVLMSNLFSIVRNPSQPSTLPSPPHPILRLQVKVNTGSVRLGPFMYTGSVNSIFSFFIY
jgi:hypothetical protein